MGSKSKGPKPNLNVSSAVDLEFAKRGFKEQGKDIGSMPDATDEKWINIWIDMFEKAYPGMIYTMRKDVENEMLTSGITKNAELSKQSQLRKGFWLPEQLQLLMEKAYPSFFVNKRHTEWFIRKFPVFSFENAAKRVKR